MALLTNGQDAPAEGRTSHAESAETASGTDRRQAAIPPFRDAHVYSAFDQLIRRTQTWLRGRTRSTLGYAAADVEDRIAQRVVELAMEPFAHECMRRTARGEPPPAEGVLALGGLYIDFATGAARPDLRTLVKAFAEFLAFSFAACVKMFFGAPLPSRTSATLVFGIGAEGLFVKASDAGFVKFCKDGPVVPLAHARQLIIQSVVPHTSSQRDVFYDRFPLFFLARSGCFSGYDRVRCLFAQMRAFLSFVRAVRRQPLLAVLARDLANTPLAAALNDVAAIEAVVITNSSFGAQPLWMRALPRRRFSLHMVWYSQNVIPFVYAQDPIVAHVPAYRHIRCDESWVWTADFAGYLRRLGVTGKIQAVGPILWQLPESPLEPRRGDEFRIAVFDITPALPEIAERLGVVFYYYSVENVGHFIDTVVSARDAVRTQLGKPVRILLKHKRVSQSIHDSRYQQLVANLEGSRQLELVDTQINLHALMASVDLAIVIPYSSPAYVASAVGTPAIYYDPTSQLLPTHLPAPCLSFASGPAQLAEKMSVILGGRRSERSAVDNAPGAETPHENSP